MYVTHHHHWWKDSKTRKQGRRINDLFFFRVFLEQTESFQIRTGLLGPFKIWFPKNCRCSFESRKRYVREKRRVKRMYDLRWGFDTTKVLRLQISSFLEFEAYLWESGHCRAFPYFCNVIVVRRPPPLAIMTIDYITLRCFDQPLALLLLVFLFSTCKSLFIISL